MKMRLALPLLLVAAPLLAGGEYDALHFGFRLGAAWSPDKSFGTLGSQPPGTDSVASSSMQFAGVFGLQAQYAVLPGHLSVGLIADGLRTVHREMGSQSGDGGTVSQNILRGELRFAFAGRGNQNPGMSFWISPTYNVIQTKNALYSLSEHKAGGAIGLLGTNFHETYTTYWEAGVYVLPKLSSGTEAGTVSLEIKVGWLF